jgi:hypothetical protein
MDHTKKVNVHDLVEIFAVFPAAPEANSCVESKKGDFAY